MKQTNMIFFPLRFLNETSRWQMVGFCVRKELTVCSRAAEWVVVLQAVIVSLVRSIPPLTSEDSHGGKVMGYNFIGSFLLPNSLNASVFWSDFILSHSITNIPFLEIE